MCSVFTDGRRSERVHVGLSIFKPNYLNKCKGDLPISDPRYSAVCGTGRDTIPMAGDVSQQQIERILGDVATLAFKWKKPLTARLLPVAGKKVGDRTEFNDPFLVNALIRAIA